MLQHPGGNSENVSRETRGLDGRVLPPGPTVSETLQSPDQETDGVNRSHRVRGIGGTDSVGLSQSA